MKFKGMSKWDRSIAYTVHLKEYVLGAVEVSLMDGAAVSCKNVFTHVCPGVWWEVPTEILFCSGAHTQVSWWEKPLFSRAEFK